MATIEKKAKLTDSKGTEGVLVLFDSGASYSSIRPELAKRLGHEDSVRAIGRRAL